MCRSLASATSSTHDRAMSRSLASATSPTHDRAMSRSLTSTTSPTHDLAMSRSLASATSPTHDRAMSQFLASATSPTHYRAMSRSLASATSPTHDISSTNLCQRCFELSIPCTVTRSGPWFKPKKCDAYTQAGSACLFSPPIVGTPSLKLSKTCTGCQAAYQSCKFTTSDSSCNQCIKNSMACTFASSTQGARRDLQTNQTNNVHQT